MQQCCLATIGHAWELQAAIELQNFEIHIGSHTSLDSIVSLPASSDAQDNVAKALFDSVM